MKIIKFLFFIILDVTGFYNIFYKRYIGLLYPWILFLIFITFITTLHDSNFFLGVGVILMIIFMLLQIKKDIFFYLQNEKKLKLKQCFIRSLILFFPCLINVFIAFYVIGFLSVDIGWIPRMA